MIIYMENIREYTNKKKQELKERLSGKQPVFYIIQVGDVEASNVYVRNKMKDCAEVGIKAELLKLPESISQCEFENLIYSLNDNENSVDAYMTQLPLPKHLDLGVLKFINPLKDADGFTGNGITNPATPQGIIDYLEGNNFKFEDANAVVIGRSDIVGKPMAKLLLDRNCNVRVVHSKTSSKNKQAALKGADLIVVATGHRNTLTDDDLIETSENCFIVDVGISRNNEGRWCGDCESVTIRETTPVPGGVGLLTRLALLNNIVKLYDAKLREQKEV